jgi:hypothetical protein
MADVALETVPGLLSSGSEKDELVLRLDDLLERYLHTLDAYQKAQQQLTQHLSAVSNLQKNEFSCIHSDVSVTGLSLSGTSQLQQQYAYSVWAGLLR